jgi:hypothetical protein
MLSRAFGTLEARWGSFSWAIDLQEAAGPFPSTRSCETLVSLDVAPVCLLDVGYQTGVDSSRPPPNLESATDGWSDGRIAACAAGLATLVPRPRQCSSSLGEGILGHVDGRCLRRPILATSGAGR